MPLTSQLAENLQSVRERIAAAARRAGRRHEEITLIAVSKTHSAKKIQELYEAGIRHFAENRVQEREAKLTGLSAPKALWHMIGHVQKNKATRAAALFDSVDSLDSIALAEKLDRARTEFSDEAGKPNDNGKTSLRVLIEAKLDPQPAKSGVKDGAISDLLRALQAMRNLSPQGLMGIPPYFDNPEDARPYFRHLRELRDAARAEFGHAALPVLSMGMSHDMEVAIEEGATEVRIGTALFGERERM